jgi:hypothetical protein
MGTKKRKTNSEHESAVKRFGECILFGHKARSGRVLSAS